MRLCTQGGGGRRSTRVATMLCAPAVTACLVRRRRLSAHLSSAGSRRLLCGGVYPRSLLPRSCQYTDRCSCARAHARTHARTHTQRERDRERNTHTHTHTHTQAMDSGGLGGQGMFANAALLINNVAACGGVGAGQALVRSCRSCRSRVHSRVRGYGKARE